MKWKSFSGNQKPPQFRSSSVSLLPRLCDRLLVVLGYFVDPKNTERVGATGSGIYFSEGKTTTIQKQDAAAYSKNKLLRAGKNESPQQRKKN
jgi:hypothetical protein